MKKKAKRTLLAVLAAVALAGAVYALASPLRTELVRLSPRTATVTFTEQGVYDYQRSFQVYPLVAGEVLEVLVEEGASVSEGDVLAVVSAADYRYQIEQLESAIRGYHSQLYSLQEQERQQRDALALSREALAGQQAALQAQLETAGAGEESREKQLALQQDVVVENYRLVRQYRSMLEDAQDFGSEGDAAQMELSLAQAKQAYASSQMLLEQLRAADSGEGYLQAQAEGIQAQLDAIDVQLSASYTGGMAGYYGSLIESAQTGIRQLDEKQGQATVTAPVSGVVGRLFADGANVVTQQTQLATIQWNPYVEVFVPTRELDGVREGDGVLLTVGRRGGDETTQGTVARVEEKAQVRLSALGVEERKVRVLIRPDAPLTIGEAVDATFTVYSRAESLVVPKTAVFTEGGQDMVWAVREGAARRVPVETGMETRDGYVVEAGLQPEDVLVKDANTQGLAGGKRVRDAPG